MTDGNAAEKSLEIADPVPVGIHIGADGETIEHAVLVPEVVDHGAGSPVRSAFGLGRHAAR